MKKYIKPELTAKTIKLRNVIAASAPNLGIDRDVVGVNPGDFEVKHRDDFDDFEGNTGGDWGNMW